MARRQYTDPSADTRDLNRANRFQREDDRRRRDAVAVAAGGRPGMSKADQDGLVGGDGGSALSNTPSDALVPRMRTPSPVAADNAARAVAGSAVPTSNQFAANGAATRAASPGAFSPERNPALLNLGNQRITSGGPAAVDAALQRNIALTQPGGGRGLLSPVAHTERPAAPMVAQASPGMGKVPPDSTGDALFGQRPVGGQSQYGTASVRQAAPGEKLAPAVVTANGVSRDGPVDRVAMDADLRTKHPELFVAGSAHNKAFLDHATRYGVDDAYRNADSLMASVKNESTPSGATANRDAGTAPTPEAVASLDKTVADAAPSVPRQVGQAARSAIQTGNDIGTAIAGAPAKLGGLVSKGFNDLKQGFSGNPAPTQVAPAAPPRLPSPVAGAPVTPAPETEEQKRKRLMSPVASL